MDINVEMLLLPRTHQSPPAWLSYKDGGRKLYDPVPLLAQLRARGVINCSPKPSQQRAPLPILGFVPNCPREGQPANRMGPGLLQQLAAEREIRIKVDLGWGEESWRFVTSFNFNSQPGISTGNIADIAPTHNLDLLHF